MKILKKLNTAHSRQWFGVMAIPFTLSQWTPFQIEIIGSPKVDVRQNQLNISTQKTAGGYAYFLDQPIKGKEKNTRLSWKWKVEQFPNVTPTIPFSKSEDDFALRVGILFSDGRFRIPIPLTLKSALKKRSQALSYVTFYCTDPSASKDNACGESPFNRNIYNCLQPASKKMQDIAIKPFQDLKRIHKLSDRELGKLEMIGVWLFADSDNSDSSSSALISNLTVLD